MLHIQTNAIPLDKIVWLCVNDIKRATFLDHIATGKNEPAKLGQVVAGAAELQQAGAAWETATWYVWRKMTWAGLLSTENLKSFILFKSS